MSAALKKAIAAKLWDYFHVPPWDFARLTDRQIAELAFHPRDKKTGQIKVPGVEEAAEVNPQRKETLESELANLDVLASLPFVSMTPEQVEALRQKIRDKYAAKGDAGAEDTNG